MANPILSDLEAQVARSTEVVASAVILINGIAGRIQKAVDAAIANGATAAELAPVAAEAAALKASSTALADAVAANTDAEPPTTEPAPEPNPNQPTSQIRSNAPRP